ncbi:MAG: phosphoglucomutase [Treponema sp.]|nr:phosphoglucomutase [Treponema sp.]
MILSASGWRKVFAESGDENDNFPMISEDDKLIASIAASVFADFILDKKRNPSVILGIDTRPTGPQIADAMLRIFMAKKIAVSYAGIIAAPEIMAYAHTSDGFVYISASHNPIGHNGIKFGLNDGGVLKPEENAKLIAEFEKRCAQDDIEEHMQELWQKCSDVDLDWVFAESIAVMREASSIYRTFAKTVISATNDITRQNRFFAVARGMIGEKPLGVVCDMNGSSRTLSIDDSFLKEIGINFYQINEKPGKIVHGIIPEPENLVYVAREMERLHDEGHDEVLLGYMPDCDGDRGNFVTWNEKTRKAEILKAQEVFALSVLSELAYDVYKGDVDSNWSNSDQILQFFKKNHSQGETKSNLGLGMNLGVVANCPTSMRIEDIAEVFNAKVFRAEVGEANVVNLAREKRNEGYKVRILGEGSNGGNITHPAAVRDPLNTLFALLKLIVIKDSEYGKGLFHIWCEGSGQMEKYEACKDNITLIDVLDTLPKYATTGVSEPRAILHIQTEDHAKLKLNFQAVFEEEWAAKKEELKEKYGFFSYEVIATVRAQEIRNVIDYSISGKGGLKVLFYDENKSPLAFIWMRGSGTEPVFRIMADVKSTVPNYVQAEKELLEWETEMISKADNAK